MKVIADQNRVWGLQQDGWALMGTNEGQAVFPVWPAEDYAIVCATGDWQRYVPTPIPMDSFLHDLLPSLKKSATLLGIFPTPDDKGVTPTLEQVENDVKAELSRIE